MVQLVVFVIALAAVYALKAWAVSRTHEELVADSTSFSWMRADALESLDLPVQETEHAAVPASRVASASMHRAQGASA